MLTKLFNKIEKQITAIRPKTEREIIEEIHHTFYTEVDRLLEEAKISKSFAVDEAAINKAERLRQLGFVASKDTVIGMDQMNVKESEKRENEAKKSLIKAIDYFSFKYPMYKFITEESVKRICEKYGLIYGPVNRYTGDVPTKNLIEIERFSISKEDQAWEITASMLTSRRDKVVEITSYEMSRRYNTDSHGFYNSYRAHKCSMEIAAPVKDFNTEGMELKGFKLSKIEVPDPVVLMPVIYNGTKHYLIVTAWGLEASDPDVMNEKMN